MRKGAVQRQHVVWTGKLTPEHERGCTSFRLYSSSYLKVFVDGRRGARPLAAELEPLVPRFRARDEAGKPVDIRIEWEPNARLHRACSTAIRCPSADRHSVASPPRSATAIDYYFVGGARHGRGDRRLSRADRQGGDAAALGLWLLAEPPALRDPGRNWSACCGEYRRRGLPIDNIVQDWFYWPEDSWGSHDFDPARFPDPQAMVDEVHALDARIMISVWPKFYPTTENYSELDATAHLSPRARRGRRSKRLGRPRLRQHLLRPLHRTTPATSTGARSRTSSSTWASTPGGWIPTSRTCTPTCRSRNATLRMGPTAIGPGAAMFNSYPLVHAEGVYDNLREFSRTRGRSS